MSYANTNDMGLDTTHNCFHGAYSSFNRFRYSLAAQIGVDLDEYNGYSKSGTKNLEDIDHGIMPLLNHSDCEGRLKVSESRKIVEGLNAILGNFNNEIKSDYDFKDRIIQFRDGCIEAISKREMIKFH